MHAIVVDRLALLVETTLVVVVVVDETTVVDLRKDRQATVRLYV